MKPSPPEASLWQTLQQKRFAALWSAWLMANLCVWMTDVAAGWIMTSLTDSKFMVAMIQTASTLPVFLLALPGGTLADRMSRSLGFMSAQLWATLILTTIGVLALGAQLSPLWLLALVFAVSLSTAVRWPMFIALVPDVVPRPDLPQAVSLNGMAVNASRLAGPLLAGLLVAAWGGVSVFFVAAGLSLVSALLVARAGRSVQAPSTPSEPWVQALWAGPLHAWQDRQLRVILFRAGLFFISTTALLGLLPSLARHLGEGQAQVYALLFSALGGGAVVVGFVLHPLRHRLSPQALASHSAIWMGLSVMVLAWTDAVPLALAALFVAGMAWMAGGNTLNLAAQLAMPDALRARGMAVFLMFVMAGGALGAACFGALADLWGLRAALYALGGFTAGAAWLNRRWWRIDH